MSLTITNTTKGKLPRLPFVKMANEALGNEYECSLVIISPRKSRILNRTYREKDTSTDILSFPLGESEGEIFLDLTTARKKSVEFTRSYRNFIGFLFIHGLVHLKGYDHGATMEKQEEKLRKIFKI